MRFETVGAKKMEVKMTLQKLRIANIVTTCNEHNNCVVNDATA